MKNFFLNHKCSLFSVKQARADISQSGVSLIGALIAIAILGILGALTATQLSQQNSVSASSDLEYERDFMRRYLREGIDCCQTLSPWPTKANVGFSCNTINTDTSNILLHSSPSGPDFRKYSVTPLNSNGQLLVDAPALSSTENAYSYGRWKFALRCNSSGANQKFLTIHSWRLGEDPRTGQDLSLADEYITPTTTNPNPAFMDLDSHRLCASAFLGGCP